MDNLLTKTEAAKIRKVHFKTIDNWIKRGLPTQMKYGRILIDRADLLAFEPGKAGRKKMTK